MTTDVTRRLMPELPWPGQEVCWRDPEQARACGWEAVFGPGPFVVVRTVDHSADGLVTGLVLRTAIGEREIHEVWMALAEEGEGGAGTGRATPVAPIRTSPAHSQGR